MRIGAAILLIWILIGVAAAYQRDYFSRGEANCAKVGTTLLTVAAGPLNYAGANPKIECEAPQPSS